MRVKDLMPRQARTAVTVWPTSSVHAVAQMLKRKRVSALVISPDGKRADGIVTERDVVRAVGTHGAEALRFRVAEICLHRVKTCSPRTDAKRVADVMLRDRIRHMPVMDGGVVVGVVDASDLLRGLKTG